MSASARDLASFEEVPEGGVKPVSVSGKRLVLCKVQGRVFAIEDRCTHDDGPLGGGKLDGHAIVCPRHGGRFDVRTGEVLRMPAAYPCRVFPVTVRDGRILVDLES